MKQNRKLTKVLLMVYLLALTWIILFKLQMDFSNLRDMNYRSVNLIPFAGSGIVNDRVDVSEILLNVAAFVPFGIYVSMLKPDGGFWKKVLPISCVSLFYEVMQYVLAIGGSDITDLIGNTLGGVVGIGVFAGLYRLFGKKIIKILNILALIGTVAAVAFLALLVIANLKTATAGCLPAWESCGTVMPRRCFSWIQRIFCIT